MTKLREATRMDFKNLQDKICDGMSAASSFEEAAQHYTAAIYQEYKESIVLVRLFATAPYGILPAQDKDFVDTSAASKGISRLLHDQTLIISLLGTYGVESDWNDRKKSREHLGIPLVPEAFVDLSLMIPRFLTQIGMTLDWVNGNDPGLIKKTMGIKSGLYVIPDAISEVDSKGRKIITAQHFITTYGVKTVFGFGGGYLGTKTFSITAIFLREILEEGKARQFSAAMTAFKAKTASLVKNKIFA